MAESKKRTGIVPAQDDILLPLLPLKNVVILPKSIIPIIVGRESSIKAVEHAIKEDKSIFITAQKEPKTENPTINDVFEYGTRSIILQTMRMPNGALKILAEGISRAKVVTSDASQTEFLSVYCKDVAPINVIESVELEALWRQLRVLYQTYTKLNEKAPAEFTLLVSSPQDMDQVVDTIAVHLNLTFEQRQEFLELADLKNRIINLCSWLHSEIEILQVEQRIKGEIQTQVEKSQKEFYLTEQIKAIHKELGREDHASDIAQIRAKVKKLGLPADAQEKADKELKRLEQMPPLSSEAAVSRNYIDLIISLPWKQASKDTISLEQAEDILNKHHASLEKPKERIIEFLAAKKFNKKGGRSPIICLVGPPGVGKTTLARSIAESLGREFVRISLGGVRDEAEIRGHRRTYIGALPGKIVQAMKKAKTINPVILLDEIDKISRDTHGDPAAALLEVLDPEQNKAFVDHFLEVEYNLSNVIFITTANMMDSIPYPLLDRMEIIFLSGYTEEEKKVIARKFLIPKNLQEYGLSEQQCVIDDNIVHILIASYCKEAGVRQLERLIAKLMRKSIQMLLHDKKLKHVTVTPELVKEWLGYPRFKKANLQTTKQRIGLATGLAWTEVGGDVLEIEATAIPGKGGLTLTGQLGEVMQESAHAALSYIRARATDLGLKSSFYNAKDLHIHIPEGATPKDGPSAGIAIATALVSALKELPTKGNVAMTGEITLQGRVLPVGGLKEKLLAAKQYELDTVILPKENEDEIKEIQKDTKLDGLTIIYVTTMDEVLAIAFEKSPFEAQESKKISKKTKNSKKNNGKKALR